MPIFANDSQFEYGAPLIEGFSEHEGNTGMGGGCQAGYVMATNEDGEQQCYPSGTGTAPVSSNPNAARIQELETELAKLKSSGTTDQGTGGGASGSSTTIVSGCTDSNATNYNSDATQDDGSCNYGGTTSSSTTIVSGCTDPTATNYDSNATQNDGSCNFAKGEMFSDYEGFQGNNMVDNGVGNLLAPQQNLVDINLLLKSLLFACLFYILSHADVAKMLKGVIGKLSQEHQRLSMLVLFAVCYYVINMFI